MYKPPLAFGVFHHGPAPACAVQPHRQPPCPSHLISIHPLSSLPCWPRLAFPHQLHWGGGNRYCSQVSAPAFGRASWTTNTCAPQPALLAAQPAVAKASSGAISMPGLSGVALGADAHPIWTSQLRADHRAAPSIQKSKRHSWGAPEREGAEDHGSAGLLSTTESRKTMDRLVLCEQLQKLTTFLPPFQRFGSPRASCLQCSQGRGCSFAY